MRRRSRARRIGDEMRKRLTKQRWRLRLVIDVEPPDRAYDPYDVDKPAPWPLGTYDRLTDAINARNAMVMIDPPASGDPRRDKAALDGRATLLTKKTAGTISRSL